MVIKNRRGQLVDSYEEALNIAEKVLRPYLETGAVFGICPDHRFSQKALEDDLPMHLAHDIAAAIERELGVIRDN